MSRRDHSIQFLNYAGKLTTGTAIRRDRYAGSNARAQERRNSGSFAEDGAMAGANHNAILDFMVEDVEAAFDRLNGKAELVHAPKLLGTA